MNLKFLEENLKDTQREANSNSRHDEFIKRDYFDYIVNQNQVFSNLVLSDIYVKRGNENYLKKDYCSAYKDYEEALELFPESSIPYFNLGVLYQKGLYFDEALDYFNKAIKNNPSFCEAYFHRAILKIKMGFDECSEKDITNDFYNGIHHALCEDGDFFEKSTAEFQMIESNIGSFLKTYFKGLFTAEYY